MKPTLRNLSDLAMILAAVAVCAVAVKQFLAAPGSNGQNLPNPVRVNLNAKIDLPAVDFQRADQTLLLVASSNCRYCNNSMGFYKRVSALDSRRHGRLRFVVVGGESHEVLSEYFNQNFVEVDEIVSVDRTETPSAVTPTLILVGRDGTVKAIWRGQQSEAGERAVVEAVS